MRRSVWLCLIALALSACDDDDASTPADLDTDIAIGDGGLMDTGPGQDAQEPDLGVADAATDASVPTCNAAANLGLRTALTSPFAGDIAQFSPRAVWTGLEWGVAWLEPAAEVGLYQVRFGRLDREGAPLGEPVTVGQSALPQHRVVHTGTGFVVVWKSARGSGGGYNGVQLQHINVEGELTGEPQPIPTTFDVEHLAVSWAPLGTGILVYDRGRNGANGVFAVALYEDAAPGAANRLGTGAGIQPGVAFGDGLWGVAWLDPAASTPSDLLFVLVDEAGHPVTQVKRREGAGARGDVHVAYGAQGTYAVGWSRQVGERFETMVTLLDSAGDVLATPPIAGPEAYGRVTAVSWLEPATFAVAWQDNQSSGVRVGVTQVNANGQVRDPFTFEPSEGANQTDAVVVGNITRAGAFLCEDPTPTAVGYSAQARVRFAVVGSCR